jgi:formylmethanofuran dehydrogenase subunit E
MSYQIQEIGVVKSRFKEPADPFEMRKWESTILIHKAFEEGLYRIEENPYIQVIFNFHQASEYVLKPKTYNGTVKGVFASRSPRRPSSLGITTVKLLGRNGCELRVRELDAIDGTPVFDIKPYTNVLDAEEQTFVEEERLKANPRREFAPYIRNKDIKTLLLKAGQLHGHYCPGLAMGVLAATDAMQQIAEISDGMEKLLAIVETNSCFVDGIQFVTGCTLGNNSLIYREYGKTAFTLTDRSGNGVRYAVKPDFRERLRETSLEFHELFTKVVKNKQRDEASLTRFKQLAKEASFAMVDLEPEQIFKIERVQTTIPEYAAMVESVLCDQCGESVMETRIVEQAGQHLCRGCAQSAYYEFTGNGVFLREGLTSPQT